MLEVRRYQPGDLYAIEPRDYERELDSAGIDCSQIYATGTAFTLFEDNRPVMAGGVVPHWPSRGEAWLRLSPWIEHHPKSGYAIMRELFRRILVCHPEMSRIEAPICATMAKNLRLVRHLGFEHEGLMRKWSPTGDDYVMTALVR